MMDLNENKIDQSMEYRPEDCTKVLTSIKHVLLEKNRRYGNSALSPLGVFYKGDATNSISIRLDDKLSRIKNANVLRKNDLFDLLGYCILYLVNNVNRLDAPMYNSLNVPMPTFEERVDECLVGVYDAYTENRYEVTRYSGCLGFSYDGFNKTGERDLITDCLNGATSSIKDDHDITYSKVEALITYIVIYFIVNNITDFTDLID